MTSLSLMAQWPCYPSRGVPKTLDGKPDLTGATPRLANGKRDFSWMWENARGGGPNGGQRGAAGGKRGAAQEAPAAATELIEFICEDRDATRYVGGK